MAEILEPCPSRPNCVSTLAREARHSMAPLSFEGSAQAAQRRMREILERIPRAILREDRPGRLAVSFRSRIFRFVDDAEFVFDAGKKEVHFRSGARVGYYDFGVNRARMERIARAFRGSR